MGAQTTTNQAPGQTPDATHKDTMTPHTGITQEVAGSRIPGTVQLEALDHHTLWNQDAVTSGCHKAGITQQGTGSRTTGTVQL